MAKFANLAGMASALVVGLGSGVLLAVMNPLIPNQDATHVAAAPKGAAPVGVSQDSVPVLGGTKPEAANVAPKAAQPMAGAADDAPTADNKEIAKVKVGAASELPVQQQDTASSGDMILPKADKVGDAASVTALAQPGNADAGAVKPREQVQTKIDMDTTREMVAPQLPGDQGDALALPSQQGSATPAGNMPALPAVDAPSSPTVSTAPAAPTVLAKPDVKISGAGTAPQAPNMDSGPELQASNDPARVAVLPKQVMVPDASGAAPVVEEPKRKVNKSGTFNTRSSSLATTGSAGFKPRAAEETTTKFPKIGAAKVETAAEAPKTKGALLTNAVAFAGGDKPLLSIVLIDIGADGLPRKTLKNLTIPAAFALAADQEGVGGLAQEYVDAGFEVLALSPRSVGMSLSGGLDQAQVDAVIEQIFTKLPQAIGLIDRTSGDLQKDRKLAKSVVTKFSKTGHGLVSYAEGLNPIPRAAAEMEVASGTIYRILDGRNEGADVITRFLDRAVLDARRNGHVIVLGTTTAQTVAAIVTWTLGSKARGVTLAPVSASLLQGNQ